MELRAFVSETLTQIQEGVQDAINRRAATAGAAGVINPVWSDHSANDRQQVEFDVAVTVSETQEKGAQGGLKVFSVEMGAKGSKANQNTTVSRVKFGVQVIWPTTIVRPE